MLCTEPLKSTAPSFKRWTMQLSGHAPYNQSVLRLPPKDESGYQYLAAYRIDDERLYWSVLDSEFRETRHGNWALHHNPDPRLVLWGPNSAACVTHWWWHTPSDWHTRIELREIDLRSGANDITGHWRFDTILDMPGYQKPPREKNWAPFAVDDELYFVYQVAPHVILRFDRDAGAVRLHSATERRKMPWNTKKYGSSMLLNSPPVPLDDSRYLSTFHTKTGSPCSYFTGFYVFESKPPYRILQMSPEPVLGPEHATGTCWRNQYVKGCVFITDLHILHEDGIVRLFGGDNDAAPGVWDFNLDEVLDSLVTL